VATTNSFIDFYKLLEMPSL